MPNNRIARGKVVLSCVTAKEKSRSFVFVIRSGLALWFDFTAGEAFAKEISECSCKLKCQCLSIPVRKAQNNNQTLFPLWSNAASATEKQTDKHNECLHIPALTGDAGRVGVNGRRGAARQPLMISPLFQRTEKSHYLPPHYPAIPHMVDGPSLSHEHLAPVMAGSAHLLTASSSNPSTLLPLKPPALYITFNTLTLTVYNVSILQNHSANSSIAEESLRKINTTLGRWQ